jgi:hypothetical protein
MGKAVKRRKRRLEAKAEERGQRRRWIWIGASVIVVLLLVGVVAWSVQKANQPVPGEAISIQGQQHIQPGQSHPPYETSLPDEQLVHNLEHGHVIISYDCAKLADCEDVKAELRRLVDRFQRWKIVAVARENADAAIALTAWGRIDKMDSYDEDRIEAFVRRWRNRGPENTPE